MRGWLRSPLPPLWVARPPLLHWLRTGRQTGRSTIGRLVAPRRWLVSIRCRLGTLGRRLPAPAMLPLLATLRGRPGGLPLLLLLRARLPVEWSRLRLRSHLVRWRRLVALGRLGGLLQSQFLLRQPPVRLRVPLRLPRLLLRPPRSRWRRRLVLRRLGGLLQLLLRQPPVGLQAQLPPHLLLR